MAETEDVYEGAVIEESLQTKDMLKAVEIFETTVEEVTERHQTPWLKQWTIHSFRIPAERANSVAQKFSESLAREHEQSWYVDFKNSAWHYVVFPRRIFKVSRKNPTEYVAVERYGTALGIPPWQLDFAPEATGLVLSPDEEEAVELLVTQLRGQGVNATRRKLIHDLLTSEELAKAFRQSQLLGAPPHR